MTDKDYFSDASLRDAALLAEKAMLNAMPSPSECKHEFSEEFEEKMKTLIIDRNCVKKKHGRKKHVLIKQVAAIFLTVIIMLGAWLSIDTEARAALVNWICEIFDSKVVYSFFGVKQTDEMPSCELTWVPEGFVLFSGSNSPAFGRKLYIEMKTGESLIFEYFDMSDNTYVELIGKSDEYELVKVEIGGVTGDFYRSVKYLTPNNLIWTDEEKRIVFIISGNIEKSIIIRIAESIEIRTSTAESPNI